MATLTSINLKIGSSWTTLSSLTYPVGAYYLSNNSTSPASLFGGTWTQVTDDRFLCGASSVTTGGDNYQTFTEADIPNHSHGYRSYWSVVHWLVGTSTAIGTPKTCVAYDATQDDPEPSRGTGYNWGNDNKDSVTVCKMPLYRSCYMWYRTA